jgi:hypothetical protein
MVGSRRTSTTCPEPDIPAPPGEEIPAMDDDQGPLKDAFATLKSGHFLPILSPCGIILREHVQQNQR